MGVASHLGINLSEYDERIRTFIPQYEEMLETAASAVPRRARSIVDLGTGTGALAARCLRRAPQARLLGIDADTQILELAKRRLGERAQLLWSNFGEMPLPSCDAVVASLALHHIPTRGMKRKVYERIGSALRRGGIFISADCHPAESPRLAREQRQQWKAHLLASYTRKEATALFAAWAREDTYMPLETEIELLRSSGLTPEVLWRKGIFAVLLGLR